MTELDLRDLEKMGSPEELFFILQFIIFLCPALPNLSTLYVEVWSIHPLFNLSDA